MKRFYLVMAICVAICLVVSGCGMKKIPANFPSKLVQFSVKLTHKDSPVTGAAVSLVADGLSYSVIAYTDSSGVAQFETSINTFSKPGVPPATYKAIITHTPKAPSELSNEQLGKMSMEEVNAYRAKVDAEIAAMPKIVPDEWGNFESTPIKITIPESGGNKTIEITDPKTFQ